MKKKPFSSFFRSSIAEKADSVDIDMNSSTATVVVEPAAPIERIRYQPVNIKKIVAIGKYSSSLLDFLDGHFSFYKDCEEGDVISITALAIPEESVDCVQKCFGIDCDSAKTWRIRPDYVLNMKETSVYKTLTFLPIAEREIVISRFRKLAELGFNFFYQE